MPLLLPVKPNKTSSYPGCGLDKVSTCSNSRYSENLGLGLSDNFHLGEGHSGVNFGHPKSEVFQNGGGYSGVNFGHPKSEVFQNGGGYSGVNFGHPKSEVFRNGGGLFQSKLWSFPIFGGWGGTLSQVKTQSAKICLNFNLGGGVLSAKSKLKVPRSA